MCAALAAEQPLEIIGHGSKRAIGLPTATQTVAAAPGLEVQSSTIWNHRITVFNKQNEFLADPLVRRAFDFLAELSEARTRSIIEAAAADKARKEKVEKRNALDSLRVQALAQLEENEGAAQDAKDKLKAAADEAEEAVRSDDDAKIADAQKKLEEELRSFMTASQGAAQGQPEGAQAQANKADDDVIDADFKPAE